MRTMRRVRRRRASGPTRNTASTSTRTTTFGCRGTAPPCASPGNTRACVTGAYSPSAPPDPDFRNPVHCIRLVADLVYVCDRVNDRIQVFKKNGDFVQEFFEKTNTLANGSMWDIAPSLDRRQTFLHVTDGENNHVYHMLRLTGEIVGQFSHNGRNAGQFHWIHVLDIDAHGTIYTR